MSHEGYTPFIQHDKNAEELIDENFPLLDKPESHHVSPLWTNIMTCVILMNCIQIGAECQWDRETYPASIPFYFSLDVIFLLLFIVDAALKIYNLGFKSYIQNCWNLLDFVLTIFMFADVLIFLVDSGHVPQKMKQVGRMTRLARCLRLIRVLRVLKAQPELVVVVEGLLRSASSLMWVLITLFVVMYIFAIFFVIMVDHNIFAGSDVDLDAPVCEKDPYFCDLGSAMCTLLDIVIGDTWGDVFHPFASYQPWLILPIILFILIAVFGIINVIVGVIVDATAETKVHIQWKSNREKLLEVSTLYESEIVKAGISKNSMKEFEGETLKEKKKERREKIENIIQSIIDSGLVDFPAGVRPSTIISLLARDKDGDINHEDFTISLGRLLLSDSTKLILMLLINQAKGSDLIRDVMARIDGLEAKIDNKQS